jgi:hypothetical protein
MTTSSRFLAPAAVVLAGLAAGPPTAAAGERPDLRVQVELADKAQLTALLALQLDVTEIEGMSADVLLTEAQHDALLAAGFRTRVLRRLEAAAPFRGTTPEWQPEYVSYNEAVTALNGYVSAYPALTQLTSLGTSLEGRTIWALKISDNAATDEGEPEVLVIGNHHAREVISVIIPLALADSLLTNHGSDPTWTQWVDERETWIVPVLNPDGFTYSENTSFFWRKNRRPNGGGSFGVDLNRNYDYEWGHDNNGSSSFTGSDVYRGPSAASEPEIQAIQAFVGSRQFVFSISYHSYGNLVLWGPGYKPGLGEDDDVHAGFGAMATAGNGWLPGNPASGAIYITNGDSDDWLHSAPGHSPIYAFTPEVGTSSDYFDTPPSRIPTLVVEGLEPAITALAHADRPERLAPPGQTAIAPTGPSHDGTFTVSWPAPATADTQVAAYELVEKTGPGTATDGLESGIAAFDAGGWTQSPARAAAGTFSLYSGSGNNVNRICLAREGYVVQPGDLFTFQAWYNIETDWDYAYAILSTDGGRSFVNLAGTATTMSDPNGNNADNGITGSSAGWQAHSYDLSAWAGQTVWLGFRYYTDGGVSPEGIYVDDVHPVRTWATRTVLSSSIAGLSHPVSGKADGTWWYQVRGQDAEGEWGYPSADEPVVVALATDAPIAARRGAFLEPPSPSPFRGRTTVRFGLAAAGDHVLAVYDVSGRRIRVLSSGLGTPGVRAAVWDGRDEAGHEVPSGVYFLRLSSPGGDRVERAVMLR